MSTAGIRPRQSKSDDVGNRERNLISIGLVGEIRRIDK
jgi:hypothetical protein